MGRERKFPNFVKARIGDDLERDFRALCRIEGVSQSRAIRELISARVSLARKDERAKEPR